MSKAFGCIYLLVNLINGKRYVGQDQTGDPENHRWNEHIRAALKYKSTLYLHLAIRKAYRESSGATLGFSAEIIWRGSREKLNDKERHYIKKHRSYVADPLGDRSYNLNKGGDGQSGFKHTKAGRASMSVSQKRRCADSDEFLRRSASRSTPEYRAKSSASLQGWFDKLPKRRQTAISKSMRAGATLRWSDLAEREKVSLRQLRKFKDPLELAKLSAQGLKRYAEATPKQIAAWAKAIRDGHRTPEGRANCSKGAKARWASMTPEERKAYWREIHPNGAVKVKK
jgi:hypothetical protein